MTKRFTNTGKSRLDNWNENQAAHEQDRWESDLYNGAGETDFSDQARTRLEEGSEYESHMEEMSRRNEDYDAIEGNVPDAIDRKINGDVRLRRMILKAHEISDLAARKLDESDDPDKLIDRLHEQEDRLEELLSDYAENGTASEHEKDEIISRIINATRKHEKDDESASDSDKEEGLPSLIDRTESEEEDDSEKKPEFADIDLSWAEEDDDSDPKKIKPAFADIDTGWAEEDSEAGDEDSVTETKKDKLKRQWGLFRENGAGAYFGERTNFITNWLKGRRAPETEYTKDRRRVIIGAVAVAACVGAAYAAAKYGDNLSNLFDTNSAIPYDPEVTPNKSVTYPDVQPFSDAGVDALVGAGGLEVAPSGENLASWIETLSDRARMIDPGEGGFQTLKELGVPESEWHNTWEDVGRALMDSGRSDLVYGMPDGQWGWSKPGVLDEEALKVIYNTIHK